MAGYPAAELKLLRAFPSMAGNTRAAKSDLEQKFAGYLHDAMGYRRDNCDDF